MTMIQHFMKFSFAALFRSMGNFVAFEILYWAEYRVFKCKRNNNFHYFPMEQINDVMGENFDWTVINKNVLVF